MRTFPATILYVFFLLLFINCTSDSEDIACSFEVEGVEGICDVFSIETSFGGQEMLITSLIKETVMGIRDLRISIVSDPGMIISEIGLSGFNP